MRGAPAAAPAARVLVRLAPLLLSLPSAVYAWETAHRTWGPWRRLDHLVSDFEFPHSISVLAAAIAAGMLLFRPARASGATLGIVAVLVLSSTTLASMMRDGLWWAHFGAFGQVDWLNAVWVCITLVALLCVLARDGWAPAGVRASGRRGVLRIVPPWLAPAAAAVFIALAWMKIRTMGHSRCNDLWLDTNVAMTTAELWIGLLVLLPLTRLNGARIGVLLMEGTSVIACRRWMDGVPSQGCGCFGAIDASWPRHIAVAGVLGLVLAAVFVRELSLRTAVARDGGDSRPREFSLDALRGRFIAPHRVAGARHAWAPVAAAGCCAAAFVIRVPGIVEELLAAAIGSEPIDRGALFANALLAAASFAAAAYLLKPRRRQAGAVLGVMSMAATIAYSVILSVRWIDGGAAGVFDVGSWAQVVVALLIAGLCVLSYRRESGRSCRALCVGGRRHLEPWDRSEAP